MKAKSELTLVDGIVKRSTEPAEMIAGAFANAPTPWVAVNIIDGSGRIAPEFVRPAGVIAVRALDRAVKP